MKEHGPEWKYVVVLEEKDKDNLKVQYFLKFDRILKFVKIR